MSLDNCDDVNCTPCPDCNAEVASLRARLAEAEKERIETRDRCFALVAERDEARTTINLVREMVEEMRVDATRPKGGQSVGARRMPVALSVVNELASLLGPEQAAYTHKAWMEEQEKLAAAERALREAREALELRLSQTRCGCGHPACRRCADDRDDDALLSPGREAAGTGGGVPAPSGTGRGADMRRTECECGGAMRPVEGGPPIFHTEGWCFPMPESQDPDLMRATLKAAIGNHLVRVESRPARVSPEAGHG